MPYKFNQLNPNSDMASLISQLNKNFAQLDQATVTQVFKKGDDNAIIFGKYANNRYGLLISDDNGVRRVLVGQAPDDGRPGSWISKEGQDVITLLGG